MELHGQYNVLLILSLQIYQYTNGWIAHVYWRNPQTVSAVILNYRSQFGTQFAFFIQYVEGTAFILMVWHGLWLAFILLKSFCSWGFFLRNKSFDGQPCLDFAAPAEQAVFAELRSSRCVFPSGFCSVLVLSGSYGFQKHGSDCFWNPRLDSAHSQGGAQEHVVIVITVPDKCGGFFCCFFEIWSSFDHEICPEDESCHYWQWCVEVVSFGRWCRAMCRLSRGRALCSVVTRCTVRK